MKICFHCGLKFSSAGWDCPSCRRGPRVIRGYPSFIPACSQNGNGFQAGSFARLAALEERHFWFRSRNRLIIWALRRHFPGMKRFFEVGCGTGYVLSGIGEAFPGLSLGGGDLFTEGLTHSKRRLGDVELLQMDARKIPYEDEFDVMGAFDLLEHIEEDELVLSQMHRAVSGGGGIILTVPRHKFLWSQVDVNACHRRRYTSRDLRARVEGVGFKVLVCISFVSIPFPLLALSRLFRRNKTGSRAELNPGTFTNHALLKVLGVERALIQSGVRFPLGGSLLLAARKV